MILLELLATFGRLGLIAFGGALGILPEMQRVVVTEKGWMTTEQFVQAYAIGQLAPGPNMLTAGFIGFHVAGPAGAVVAAVGMFVPPAALCVAVTSLWRRLYGNPWADSVQRGVAPVALGLMAAGALTLAQPILFPGHGALWPLSEAFVRFDGRSALFAAAAGLTLATTRVNPAVVIVTAGLLGLLIP
ncbi:MAG: chromate transporter [Dehalococcoidia bacterium]|nr:chromate transporter [Dehalococcoidia bacterium]